MKQTGVSRLLDDGVTHTITTTTTNSYCLLKRAHFCWNYSKGTFWDTVRRTAAVAGVRLKCTTVLGVYNNNPSAALPPP